MTNQTRTRGTAYHSMVAFVIAVMLNVQTTEGTYVSIPTCPSAGQYWDGTESKPCADSCSSCALTLPDQTQSGTEECVCNLANAVTCDGTGATVCETGYTLGNAKCYVCDDARCSACGSSKDVCTQCEAGWSLVNNACVMCPSGCSACTSETACTTCSAGYFLNDQGSCTACPAGCATCSSAYACNSGGCLAGYAFNSGTESCDACSSNCKACSAADTCTTCGEGFTTHAGECVACGLLCSSCTASTTGAVVCNSDACADRTYRDSAGVCYQCGANCETCDTSGACTECGTSYSLQEGACVACPANCVTCSAADTCDSDGCLAGYVSISGACVKCAANCDTCTTGGTCTDTGCSTGFTWNNAAQTCDVTITESDCEPRSYVADNSCKLCGDNCLSCDADKCLQCADGHGPESGSNRCSACTASPTGMKTCAADLSTAATCETGYGLITSSCTSCGVANCETCGAAGACDVCSAGYGLNEDKTVCGACSEGCSECSSNCQGSCTACFEDGKAAPNCACASTETWDTGTNRCVSVSDTDGTTAATTAATSTESGTGARTTTLGLIGRVTVALACLVVAGRAQC